MLRKIKSKQLSKERIAPEAGSAFHMRFPRTTLRSRIYWSFVWLAGIGCCILGIYLLIIQLMYT